MAADSVLSLKGGSKLEVNRTVLADVQPIQVIDGVGSEVTKVGVIPGFVRVDGARQLVVDRIEISGGHLSSLQRVVAMAGRVNYTRELVSTGIEKVFMQGLKMHLG